MKCVWEKSLRGAWRMRGYVRKKGLEIKYQSVEILYCNVGDTVCDGEADLRHHKWSKDLSSRVESSRI